MMTELHDDLHDDDKPVSCLLSRREMLALLDGSGAAFRTFRMRTTISSSRATACSR